MTGSRIPRAQVEGPAPITVVTAEEIKAGGFSSIPDVLRSITQNGGETQSQQSSSGADFSPGAQQVDLRGLGPNHTLVLVNGRRIADFHAVQGRSNSPISSIPIGMSIASRSSPAAPRRCTARCNFGRGQLHLKKRRMARPSISATAIPSTRGECTSQSVDGISTTISPRLWRRNHRSKTGGRMTAISGFHRRCADFALAHASAHLPLTDYYDDYIDR